MKWVPVTALSALPAVFSAVPAYAVEYLTVQQVQAEYFPGAILQPVPLTLTDAQRAELRRRSGVHEPFNERGVWRSLTGGWLIVDAVVGKHEKISYAVALDGTGVIIGIEILRYNESYGGEIRGSAWRARFANKSSADPLLPGTDIPNISGATLSCKHVTQGVRRVLALYELHLKGMKP